MDQPLATLPRCQVCIQSNVLLVCVQHCTESQEQHRGEFFFKSDRFLGKYPPTIEELKKKLEDSNDTYI